MSTKHAAGPWTYRPNRDGTLNFFGDGRLILNNVFVGEANARLIAAAPELLEDLQEAWSLINFLIGHLEGRMGEGALDDMAMKADGWHETIAKATGEAQ